MLGLFKAMEFASSILDVATRLYDCIKNTTYHIRHFKDNMDSLRNEMGRLKRKRNDVKTQVETGERQPLHRRRRTEHVDGWVQGVEELERDVNDVLRQGEEEIQRESFKICPRKCWSTYKLGKKAHQKLQDVSDMSNTADNFRDVTLPLPLAPAHAQEIPLGTTVGLDSNFHKLLSLFADDGVGIIGIYGTGGVGKTTLLKKLNNELANNQSLGGFPKVIWVTVSQDLSTTESVQDKIGKTLGYPDDIWKDKTKYQKQATIFHDLKMKNFVLLLDDIWKWIDLVEVGVPILADNQNKAKVVFTTRSEQVCLQMKAKENIKVECLAWQQAWDLFKEKVGEDILNSNPEIEKLAQDVCKECAGLPLALITIGRAMASMTTPRRWNYAISELRKSRFKISDWEIKGRIINLEQRCALLQAEVTYLKQTRTRDFSGASTNANPNWMLGESSSSQPQYQNWGGVNMIPNPNETFGGSSSHNQYQSRGGVNVMVNPNEVLGDNFSLNPQYQQRVRYEDVNVMTNPKVLGGNFALNPQYQQQLQYEDASMVSNLNWEFGESSSLNPPDQHWVQCKEGSMLSQLGNPIGCINTMLDDQGQWVNPLELENFVNLEENKRFRNPVELKNFENPEESFVSMDRMIQYFWISLSLTVIINSQYLLGIFHVCKNVL